MDFDPFYTENRRRLVSAVFPVLGVFAEAEDVAQEAFQRAFVHWEKVRHYDDPFGWVRRVAYNLALNRLDRRSRRDIPLDLAAEPAVDHAPEAVLDLYRAMARLSPRDRAVLSLFYLFDLSVEQVAVELDMTSSAVRVRLVRARRQLRRELDPALDPAPSRPPTTPPQGGAVQVPRGVH